VDASYKIAESKGTKRIWKTADGQLPCIKDLKGLIKEIESSSRGKEKKLSDFNKPLADKMEAVSVSMFTKRKIENKEFTVKNKAFLKSIKIDDNTGTLNEEDTINVSEYFRNDIESFYILAAQCYIAKTSKYTTENQIFYVSCPSKYSTEYLDVFFVSQHGKFFVLFDELSSIELEPYIRAYFGRIPDGLLCLLSQIKENETANHKDLQTQIADVFNDISNEISVNHEFVAGAISFFDFLGWKGLWQENDTEPLEAVSLLIADFKCMVDNKSEPLFPYAGSTKMSTLISISDTIAVFTPKTSDVSETQLLSLHSDIARYILEKSCEWAYPIRGAISYGQYSIMNSVMIGPGIDECASWHEKCDWIGVHFTPSAQFVFRHDEDTLLPQNIVRYDKIPVKAGIPHIKYSVKWQIAEETFGKLLTRAKVILPEIAAKYINTHEYLHWVRKEDGDKQNGVGKQQKT
jgi:hypothetical protein